MPRKPKAELTEQHGIVTAEPPGDFGITSVWADPASITPHELNWKEHPEDQKAAVADLIERHGWLKPVAGNVRPVSPGSLHGHE
jgi:hypothetical protein